MLLFALNDQENRYMRVPRITLEQWAALVAVVDEGGFAKAAERLNKSQSAISYAISRLDEQLPVIALQQEGRRAALTETGEVLYRRAKQLLDRANELEHTAMCLADGWESELVVAVESVVSMEKVMQALSLFAEQAPQTRILLLETTLSGTDEALIEQRADMAITAGVPVGYLANPLGEIRMLPLAHCKHPLANSDLPLNEVDLQNYRQIVVRDSGSKRNQDAGWLEAEQRLTVSHFETAIKAVEQGLGFAFIPENFVHPQLESGELVVLNLAAQPYRSLPIYVVNANNENSGPAVQAFAKLLQQLF